MSGACSNFTAVFCFLATRNQNPERSLFFSLWHSSRRFLPPHSRENVELGDQSDATVTTWPWLDLSAGANLRAALFLFVLARSFACRHVAHENTPRSQGPWERAHTHTQIISCDENEAVGTQKSHLSAGRSLHNGSRRCFYFPLLLFFPSLWSFEPCGEVKWPRLSCNLNVSTCACMLPFPGGVFSWPLISFEF